MKMYLTKAARNKSYANVYFSGLWFLVFIQLFYWANKLAEVTSFPVFPVKLFFFLLAMAVATLVFDLPKTKSSTFFWIGIVASVIHSFTIVFFRYYWHDDGYQKWDSDIGFVQGFKWAVFVFLILVLSGAFLYAIWKLCKDQSYLSIVVVIGLLILTPIIIYTSSQNSLSYSTDSDNDNRRPPSPLSLGDAEWHIKNNLPSGPDAKRVMAERVDRLWNLYWNEKDPYQREIYLRQYKQAFLIKSEVWDFYP